MRTDRGITDPLPDDLPPGVHRLYSRESTPHVLDHLRKAGWGVAHVDLCGARDKAAIMDAFQGALALPTWFGRNWDALADSLRDLGWLAAGVRGRALIIRGAGRRDTATGQDRAVLAEILDEAVDSWAASPTPLVVLLRR